MKHLRIFALTFLLLGTGCGENPVAQITTGIVDRADTTLFWVDLDQQIEYIFVFPLAKEYSGPLTQSGSGFVAECELKCADDKRHRLRITGDYRGIKRIALNGIKKTFKPGMAVVIGTNGSVESVTKIDDALMKDIQSDVEESRADMTKLREKVK